MLPRVLDFRSGPLDPELLKVAVRHLQDGGLVAMPTETVYGFGCGLTEASLHRIRRLKERSSDKPFLLLLPGVEAAADLEWCPRSLELANVFWPGALTLVLSDPRESFPPEVRNPKGGVAVRVSPHPVAQALVSTLGQPMVSTSANRPGGLPALTAHAAREAAEALGAGEDFLVLDGGPLDPSEPSTIVDFSGPEPALRRAGAVPFNRLRCVLPELHDPNSFRM
jgi:L-threonylcarbamoyladenylate synthase